MILTETININITFSSQEEHEHFMSGFKRIKKSWQKILDRKEAEMKLFEEEHDKQLALQKEKYDYLKIHPEHSFPIYIVKYELMSYYELDIFRMELNEFGIHCFYDLLNITLNQMCVFIKDTINKKKIFDKELIEFLLVKYLNSINYTLLQQGFVYDKMEDKPSLISKYTHAELDKNNNYIIKYDIARQFIINPNLKYINYVIHYECNKCGIRHASKRIEEDEYNHLAQNFGNKVCTSGNDYKIVTVSCTCDKCIIASSKETKVN